MRVRVIRWTDPTSSVTKLVVMRWSVGQWEPVMNFELGEEEQAHEFAMKLSLTKREPVEMAMFEDGEKLERRIGPLVTLPDCESVQSGPPELAYRDQKSENSP